MHRTMSRARNTEEGTKRHEARLLYTSILTILTILPYYKSLLRNPRERKKKRKMPDWLKKAKVALCMFIASASCFSMPFHVHCNCPSIIIGKQVLADVFASAI